jgi:uncharacterized protein (TIGR02452 family)
MNIRSTCITYFNSISIVKNPEATKKQKAIAKVCIASYFLIAPPIIFAVGLTLSTAAYGISLLKHKISSNPGLISKKTLKIIVQFFKGKPKQNKLPIYLNILNTKTYLHNNKPVTIPAAGMPSKYARAEDTSLEVSLKAMTELYNITATNSMKTQFKDKSTEEAITESEGFCLALNFANEEHIGGSPGFHRNPAYDPTILGSKLFIYDSPPARAQEESICTKSTLMDSLTQLPHTLKQNKIGYMVLSMYTDPFDSTKMAYVSDNHLFAIPTAFGDALLPEPKAVAFVTSAAKSYGVDPVDCTKDQAAYTDAKQRIETHLLAAANHAGAIKKADPSRKTEIVLGAFGCGVFAPKTNSNDYRVMVAKIYRELLPKFEGFFDVVTYAVPTFGKMPDLENPDMGITDVANYVIFKNALVSGMY